MVESNIRKYILRADFQKNPSFQPSIYFLIVKLRDFYSFAIYGKSRDESAITGSCRKLFHINSHEGESLMLSCLLYFSSACLHYFTVIEYILHLQPITGNSKEAYLPALVEVSLVGEGGT